MWYNLKLFKYRKITLIFKKCVLIIHCKRKTVLTFFVLPHLHYTQL